MLSQVHVRAVCRHAGVQIKSLPAVPPTQVSEGSEGLLDGATSFPVQVHVGIVPTCTPVFQVLHKDAQSVMGMKKVASCQPLWREEMTCP